MCKQRRLGKTAQMRRFAWAFAGRLCDKYHNCMSWLNYDYDDHIYTAIKKYMYLCHIKQMIGYYYERLCATRCFSQLFVALHMFVKIKALQGLCYIIFDKK